MSQRHKRLKTDIQPINKKNTAESLLAGHLRCLLPCYWLLKWLSSNRFHSSQVMSQIDGTDTQRAPPSHLRVWAAKACIECSSWFSSNNHLFGFVIPVQHSTIQYERQAHPRGVPNLSTPLLTIMHTFINKICLYKIVRNLGTITVMYNFVLRFIYVRIQAKSLY